MNLAVVGCGRMGLRRMHSIRNHPAARLACVVDVNPADVHAAATTFGVPSFDDFRAIADDDAVDAVVVSVPNAYHAETVNHFLERGKHVFCEKPLAGTVDECRSMVETAIRHGVTLKTGSNLRYFPNVLKAKALLDEGALGTITFARGWIGHDGWSLDCGWYSDRAIIGGGTLLDNGSHLFDLIRWLVGEVVECTGVTTNATRRLEGLEDNALVIMRTEQGVPAFLQASWTEWRGYMYLEISGERGAMVIDSRLPACTTVLRGRTAAEERVYDFSGQPPSSYTDEMSDYIGCVSEGTQATPSGYDGLRAVQLVSAAYESARTGRAVHTYSADDRRLRAQFDGHRNQ